MDSRFIHADQETLDLVSEVKAQYFPNLVETGAKILVLLDTKMRRKGDRVVLGRMQKANDLVRRLTDHIDDEGCDFILYLDAIAINNIPREDKIRLIRHELRHCHVAGTEIKPVFQVKPHDIEDFIVEIELNKDKVGWARDAAEMIEIIYAQMADALKQEQEVQSMRPSGRFNRTATAPATGE